jgi:hypothetical protein
VGWGSRLHSRGRGGASFPGSSSYSGRTRGVGPVASRVRVVVVPLMLAGLAEVCPGFCRGLSADTVGVWARLDSVFAALGLGPVRRGRVCDER